VADCELLMRAACTPAAAAADPASVRMPWDGGAYAAAAGAAKLRFGYFEDDG
jgi:hypothetical protein